MPTCDNESGVVEVLRTMKLLKLLVIEDDTLTAVELEGFEDRLELDDLLDDIVKTLERCVVEAEVEPEPGFEVEAEDDAEDDAVGDAVDDKDLELEMKDEVDVVRGKNVEDVTVDICCETVELLSADVDFTSFDEDELIVDCT